MTILSDNNTTSPMCGESITMMMVSSPIQLASSTASVQIEQAALYYSPLLTAATSYSTSVLNEQNYEDNMIALDEGSNISPAQTLHNNHHQEDSMQLDEYPDECAQYPSNDCSSQQQQPLKQSQTAVEHSFKDICSFSKQSSVKMQNGAINLIEEVKHCKSLNSLNQISYCTPVYNNDDHHQHLDEEQTKSFNKLCMPSDMTSVSTKNNKSHHINTLSTNNYLTSTNTTQVDQNSNSYNNINYEETLSSPTTKEPLSYQPFQKRQFSLPDQNLHHEQLENPDKKLLADHYCDEVIINNNKKKQDDDHHSFQVVVAVKQDFSSSASDCWLGSTSNTEDSIAPPANSNKNSSYCSFTTSHHQQEDPRIFDSQLTTTSSCTIPSSTDTNSIILEKPTTTTTIMGNTIINHYFPNEVHPLGFIEMVPQCNQQQQQQQNNNRLSSTFHQHQYAVNYDHQVNSPIMKEMMMVLDEKNMTTTLTHSSSHSSLTHLSRFNGDVKQFIGTTTNNDEPSLIDLPFEMILHIITFIPHQDDLCHEYNTYWNIREKYLKKLHTEAKQSVHNQFSKKRFVKNLMESTKPNASRISISSKDSMDDDYQYMSQTRYGIFSICFVNNYMYNNYFKNVHFWKLICESYFNIPRTDCLEPPVDKKLLNAIYSKQLNGGSDCPTSKIAKLGDWLQGMLNISNSSEFSNLAIDENMGSFQATGAVQNSGSNANFFISNPPVQEELVWWQYSYHYLHSIPARFDLNPNYLLPIFQVSPKNACSEDSNMLNISGLAKENDITKNSVLYNTCISRLMETDNKKSPNDYRWRNATSEQIFTPNNLYYFEFFVEKIGGINLGVGIVPNIHFTGSDNSGAPKDFNPSHYDNYIWPSGSCHHCFEINNQRYYSGDVVGMLVDYSYSEKNVLKIHFCHNWHTKEKRSTLQNQLKKVADLENLCQNTGTFEQNVFASLLEDEINNMRNGVKGKDNEDEDDINYPFKDNQVRLIYFTDDTQTQFPECVISEGRNELISFMKVNSTNNSSMDKKKKEPPKKWDLQKERPQASNKELVLPDFKLCVTTYDKEDSVRIIKPSHPHPPLYYHLLKSGRHTQQKPPTKPILSTTEEKELRKIIMDALGEYQYSSKNHQHTTSSVSSSSNSSDYSREERNKGCSIM